jgi:hypothetical protein
MITRWTVVRWIAYAVVLALAGLWAFSHSNAQPYPGPPMWDRNYDNPEYRRDRRLPERTYDPYDRGPERWRLPNYDPMDREQYERRSFCAMHPRECP